jgi:FkbH-like protein
MMSSSVTTKTNGRLDRKKSAKCVIWDLDHTLWDGVLLEGEVALREGEGAIIETLDKRGVLQSIASKNDYSRAMQKLQEFGLVEYFLYPQIGWNSKVQSIQNIAQSINIGLDTLAFIDDQPFERDEVHFSLPEVLCLDANELDQLLARPEMNPQFITKDSKLRRQMYVKDMARSKAEEEFVGPAEAFLASLNMALTIFPAQADDLKRAEELTVRTNQLNATGYTYSYDELNHFRCSERYNLLMARLEDKYGSYGHIGLALIQCQKEVWTLKLLLMSCRVMSRGVGSIMLSHIMKLAKEKKVRLQADFVPNGRNRVMNITYRFAGFSEIERAGDCLVLESDLTNLQPFPDYVKVRIVDEDRSYSGKDLDEKIGLFDQPSVRM